MGYDDMDDQDDGLTYYHGRSQKSAKVILQEGFRVGTWFTRDFSEALIHGSHILFVKFEDRPDRFQTKKIIPPDRIEKIEVWNNTTVYEKDEGWPEWVRIKFIKEQ